MQSWPRLAALAAIRGYQRFISPHKGFACAWRVHTGGASCSALGLRVIRRHGLWRGLQLLRERTYRCGVAHRRCGHASRPGISALVAQRGSCDGCDVGDCPLDFGDCCDLSDCCDGCGDCDRSKRSDKRKRRDANQYIPPSRRAATTIRRHPDTR
jgi:putative component of membrane protein insertase Oxa1/YidC/SpoIIIJ protein YidD